MLPLAASSSVLSAPGRLCGSRAAALRRAFIGAAAGRARGGGGCSGDSGDCAPLPRRAAMATTAAAAAASATASAGEQEVQLHVLASSEAVLREFQQRFEPAEGFRCSLHYPGDAAGAPPQGFDASAYSSALSTRELGRLLLATPCIASTQEFMRRHAAVLPEGTVLVAERQTSGKGRGGNQWTSPDGCLMFTAARRLKVPGSQAPFINYLVCLAVVRGVADAYAGPLKGAAPDVAIKWPNDIYSGGLKVGGALIHTTWQGDRFSVLAGIGLNVSNRQPTTCLEELVARQAAAAGAGEGAGAGAAAAAAAVPRGAVLACVLNHLEACYDEFESAGFGGMEKAYLASWLHSGQAVEVEQGAVAGAAPAGAAAAAAAAGGGGRVRLTIAGLSESGFLLATDAAGGRWELTPDGNSLDMLVGLIRRKLPA
ncbi:hypothetical protein Rsub_07653 [Raphidocelis subcapitata]|uniref:BPL/LPL catalytic domain-containing protein n=1 Tax=Raphidocelis subcapitata TaxID=307507 RepID=A0A2V0PA83_9CHLO|nr:hypothetical protein Rsub_07653 [Raphidocelis subcapitata]|eukprot:GBF94770.1 hypothetical protein Rsub_07653 [Raphidocelis subcapitata]